MVAVAIGFGLVAFYLTVFDESLEILVDFG